MDGSPPDILYQQERRRRLAAERSLERTRGELSRAHRALVANADRLSHRYLSERETNLRLSDRQAAVLAQRKEAAERADRARRRLWHALEAMRDGFALFDSSRRLIAANSVYLNLFDVDSELGPGATAEELFGCAAEEGAFDTADLEPDEWAAAQLARWDADPIGAQVLNTFDGRTIRLQDRLVPDGDIVSLAVDISDVEERQASLAAARDSAEEVARAKAAFLARMSHEMRTPMNGVLGLAEMLSEQPIDEESLTYARTIRNSAEALLVIINDTLDVSRLEVGKVELRMQAFDLEAMLGDCLRLADAGRDADGPAVALHYPLDAPVRFVGDAGRLRQIVMNLVGNALKFTEIGHVVVRADITRASDGAEIALTVVDTGPGVPADQRDLVFEPFGQLEDGRRQKEGTGLGLTISRGLAERMGGSLDLLDENGRDGACFRLAVTLPVEGDWPATVRPQPVAIPAGVGLEADILADRLTEAGGSVARLVSADAAAIVAPAAL
ncbi:MAG: ATP-binding protein, partial [Jannaschia sp.]